MKLSKLSIIKGIILCLFLLGAFWLITRPEAQAYYSKDAIRQEVSSYGIFGPIVFVLVFAAGAVLLVPATVFVFAGAVVFGLWKGLLLVWVGGLIGASASFMIARTLGRDLAAQIVGDRLRAYDDRIAHNGFATILYLRLLFVPFAVLNYGAGLTKMRFRDYITGTAIGLLPSAFIFVFFFSSVTVTRAADLLSWQVLVAVGLVIVALLLPLLVKRLTGSAKQ